MKRSSAAAAKQAEEEAAKRASSSTSSALSILSPAAAAPTPSIPSSVLEQLAQIHQFQRQVLHQQDAELLQLLEGQRQELQRKESEIRRLEREQYTTRRTSPGITKFDRAIASCQCQQPPQQPPQY
jgi:hypothetical protein